MLIKYKCLLSIITLTCFMLITQANYNNESELAQMNRLWSVIDQIYNKVQSLRSMLLKVDNCKVDLQMMGNILLVLEKKNYLLNPDQLLVIKAYKDCFSIYSSGLTTSGVYSIWLQQGFQFINAYCDMDVTTTKRGWVIFQRRLNGEISFERGWDDYVKGFGTPAGEYWLGLSNIYSLAVKLVDITKPGINTLTKLRIDFDDWDGIAAYIEYGYIYMLPSKRNFLLDARNISGTAYKREIEIYSNFQYENFTTPDKEDKFWTRLSCGKGRTSGWWFLACFEQNLNGRYPRYKQKMSKQNILWKDWKHINPNYTALRFVSMKVQYEDYYD